MITKASFQNDIYRTGRRYWKNDKLEGGMIHVKVYFTFQGMEGRNYIH